MSGNNKNFSLTESVSSVTIELLHDKLNSLPKNSDLHKELLAYLSRDFATSTINGIREYLVIVQNLLKECNTQSEHNGRLAQHIWTIDKMLGRNTEYYSQAGQDRFIEKEFFSRKTGGVFVDIGGYDGLTSSNTLYFESFLGWRGLCVDPVPKFYELMSDIRNAVCLNVALADYNGEGSFLEINKGLTQMGGLMATLRKDLPEIVKDKGSETRQINVPVKTFQSIVSDQDLTHIDYCSIDVEGAEISVLKGIDFNKSNISVFSIENPTSLGNNQSIVRDYMENEGYQLVRSIGEDDIFAKATLLG